ncbi:MAG: isoprenylcysteine carboxylmethyltransferase family protein [Rhodothermales bacterium]|nr:isoprenylcysteine carboxylmethyltransferase family protein [Rhodothermales bacterium]
MNGKNTGPRGPERQMKEPPGAPESAAKRPMIPDLVASVLMVALLVASALIDAPSLPIATAAGVALLVIAIYLVVSPLFFLARHGDVRDGDPFYGTREVVTSGPYRLVRHPQYLGYCLLAVGLAMLNPAPLIVALALATSVFFYIQSVHEERFCRQHLGRAYESYAERVPRFNLAAGLIRLITSRPGDSQERDASAGT